MQRANEAIKLLKEASLELKATETHEDNYDIATTNYKLLSSAIGVLLTVKELKETTTLSRVNPYPFTEQEIIDILAQGGTTNITKEGVQYVFPLIVKNIINSWDKYRTFLFKSIYSLNDSQISRLTFKGAQITYTGLTGNEYSITSANDLNNLGDLV